MMRRIAIALFTVTAFGATFVSTAGADNGANNIVQVHNQADAATLARGHVMVAEDGNTDVGEGNGAIAQATCTDCRTVAAAIQLVIVESPDVTNFHPENAAVASNSDCTRCATFAFARQVVLTPYHQVVLDDATRREIAQANDQANQIVSSSDDFFTMRDELNQLVDRLVADVQADIADGGPAPVRSDQAADRAA